MPGAESHLIPSLCDLFPIALSKDQQTQFAWIQLLHKVQRSMPARHMEISSSQLLLDTLVSTESNYISSYHLLKDGYLKNQFSGPEGWGTHKPVLAGRFKAILNHSFSSRHRVPCPLSNRNMPYEVSLPCWKLLVSPTFMEPSW